MNFYKKIIKNVTELFVQELIHLNFAKIVIFPGKIFPILIARAAARLFALAQISGTNWRENQELVTLSEVPSFSADRRNIIF